MTEREQKGATAFIIKKKTFLWKKKRLTVEQEEKKRAFLFVFVVYVRVCLCAWLCIRRVSNANRKRRRERGTEGKERDDKGRAKCHAQACPLKDKANYRTCNKAKGKKGETNRGYRAETTTRKLGGFEISGEACEQRKTNKSKKKRHNT